jgi:hypothetical protein
LINFFCSVEHLKTWRLEHSEVGGKAVTVTQVADMGRDHWGAARQR